MLIQLKQFQSTKRSTEIQREESYLAGWTKESKRKMMEEDYLELVSNKLNNLIIKQTHNFHVAGNDWRLFFSTNKGKKNNC